MIFTDGGTRASARTDTSDGDLNNEFGQMAEDLDQVIRLLHGCGLTITGLRSATISLKKTLSLAFVTSSPNWMWPSMRSD